MSSPGSARPGPLAVIILVFVTSAIIRAEGIDLAGASEKVASALDQATGARNAAQTQDRAPACQRSPDVEALIDAVRKRQQNLDEREARLADRLQALRVAEKKLKENRDALIAAENKLAATLTISDKAAEKDLARLTTVYENMKPRNAARLFEAMAPQFAAGFLGRMRPDAAARVMSNIAPEKGYEISLILAGRNARAPRK